MPSPKPSSLSLRYLKARLRVLKRPMVWGSATIVLATMMVFAEYWRQSNRMEAGVGDRPGTGSNPTIPSLDITNSDNPITLSQEESAIGADIDTLPLLLREFNIPEDAIHVEPVNPTLVAPSPSATQPSPGGLEIPLILDPTASLGEAPSRNPFFPSSFSPGFTGNVEVAPGMGLNPTALTNPMLPERANPTSAPSPLTSLETPPSSRAMTSDPGSPLQTAVQTRSPLNPSAPGAQPYTGFTPSSVPSPGIAVPLSPYQPSLSIERSEPSFQTSPPPGTTGYTIPPSLRLPASATTATPVPANQTYIDSFSSQSPYTPSYNPALPQTSPLNPIEP